MNTEIKLKSSGILGLEFCNKNDANDFVEFLINECKYTNLFFENSYNSIDRFLIINVSGKEKKNWWRISQGNFLFSFFDGGSSDIVCIKANIDTIKNFLRQQIVKKIAYKL